MTQDHENRLLNLWAQLGAAMMQRGLDHARQDDPHALVVAAKWLQAGGNRFQLRTDFGPDGAVTTRGLIADDAGEPLIEIFTIVGRAAQ